ncbi:MAG: FHA domain-containing protein, partial [Acidobacteriota bacterium]
MARLVINDDTGKTQIFELSTPTISIGRAEVNDLVLNHPSISRYHARISVLPGGTVLLNDLGSLNGTYVNSQKVQEANLKTGDCINAGVYELRYEIGPATRLRIETGKTVPGHVAELMDAENLTSSLRPAPSAAPVEDVGIEARVRDLEKENHLLKLLLGVGKTLSAAHTSEETLEQVMKLIFQMENVERGFVMLRDEKKGLLPAVLLYKDDKLRNKGRDVVLSRTLIDQVIKEKLPLLIHDVSQDDRFRASESLRLSGVQSAMCAPLLYRDQVLGLFYVDCLSKVWGFTQEELSIFSVVAAEAAISLASAQSHQELAKRLTEKKALERFLDSAAVEKILANPDQISLGGENQKATILFSDLRGFTQLSEKMEPADVVELLNECFTEMTDLVFEKSGTLDKYTGDGLMVVFGAPLTRPDDARRAVETAIAMQIALQRLNEHWEKTGRRPLHMG